MLDGAVWFTLLSVVGFCCFAFWAEFVAFLATVAFCGKVCAGFAVEVAVAGGYSFFVVD